MKRLAIGLIFITLLMSTGSTQAAVRQDVDWSVTCGGFRSNGGSIFMNRDNTGEGREAIAIIATDGLGNVIFGPVQQTTFVGLSLEFPAGVAFPWSVEPAANPLSVRVVSLEGNGLGRQLVYGVDGACGLLSAPAAGIVSGVAAEDLAIQPQLALPGDPAAAEDTEDTETTEDEVTEATTTEQTIVAPSSPTTVTAPTTGDDPNAAVPAPTNPDNIGQTRSGFLVVDTGVANLRSADGSQYTIVGRVRGGEELIVLGTNDSTSWWFVQVGPVRGWINNELVFIRGDLGNVPVIDPQGKIFGPRLYTFTPNDLLQSPRLGAPAICVIPGELEYFIAGQTENGEWLALETSCGVGWLQAERGAIRNSGDLEIPVIPG